MSEAGYHEVHLPEDPARALVWQVIAEYVARRLDLRSDDLLPRLVGQVSLALTLSAYTHWLDHPDLALHDLLDEAMSGLRNYLDPA